jgi:hypothetical protein
LLLRHGGFLLSWLANLATPTVSVASPVAKGRTFDEIDSKHDAPAPAIATGARASAG